MKYYQIIISGYGGEVVFGKATLQQYEFWNNEERIADAGFDSKETAIIDYMFDIEEWESSVPSRARFSGDWYELDEYGHFNGATTDSAYITINETDSAEYNANVVATVWEGSLVDFQSAHNDTIVQSELDLDEMIEENAPFVFYGMSVEKGSFYDCTFETESDIDLTQLKFYACDLPNGDNLVIDVEYNDHDVTIDGGSTSGKAMYMEVWEW